MKVLIDTSAWIDFLREGRLKHPEIVAALESGTAALCPVTWAELWVGLRGKREETALMNIRDACHWLEIDASVWEETAARGRSARKQGLNCPLTDVLIVACAKRHGAGLVHRDKHLADLLG